MTDLEAPRRASVMVQGAVLQQGLAVHAVAAPPNLETYMTFSKGKAVGSRAPEFSKAEDLQRRVQWTCLPRCL